MLLEAIGRLGGAAAAGGGATRSATGSASPRPDRTSWLGGRVNLLSQVARARPFPQLPQLSGPARCCSRRSAAWAVQRLRAAAATLSATGSASPRPDRTSWLGGGALTSLVKVARARLFRNFRNSQGRRDALEAIGAWAVQRLRRRPRRSQHGSARHDPIAPSWLGGLRRAFSPAFRAGFSLSLGAWVPKIWRGENKAIAKQSPLLKLLESDFQERLGVSQLDCAKTQ